MDTKKNIFRILGLVLLHSANSALFGIIIRNNPSFNIKYKFAESGDNRQQTIATEKVLPAGEYIKTNEPTIAIRCSGLASTITAIWVDVPVLDDLAQQLSPNDYHEYDMAIRRGCAPEIIIKSRYTGGWSFRAGYICL